MSNMRCPTARMYLVGKVAFTIMIIRVKFGTDLPSHQKKLTYDNWKA